MNGNDEAPASTRPEAGSHGVELHQQLAIRGGAPVRRSPWPTYDKGAVHVCREDEEAAIRAIRSHLYFRYDHRNESETECGQFEAELCRYFGTRHALAVSSGTAALALAIMGAAVPPGALVACPGFTFVATPSAIVLAGCRPFLVEVDDDLRMDLDDLRRRWRPEIKAILVVHMRGFAADVAALAAFAAEMGVPLIEDAVPALGAELDGRKLGTFGVAGAFSTQSDKALNCGEGGFLVTDDSTLFGRAVALSGAYEGRLRRHFPGTEPPVDGLTLPLLSLRMDEIRAALLRAELTRLPQRLALFHRNYAQVSGALADLPGIAVRNPVAPGAYLGEAFVFRVPGGDAGWFTRALRAEGIDARNIGADDDLNVRAFWNWRFMYDDTDPARIRATLPRTARLLAETVDVPLSSSLTPDDCDQLIRAVRKVAAALPPAPAGAGPSAPESVGVEPVRA
ncbi:aminotransferase class I/II-fold pyridoxal phosphate-dependent enzyme [Micromonospora rifamycinica]|uniref:DegT/DnrJ/EryC1/StrS family aminotransferase n=1 Tax=Micromonospora rifamycinica TaxID=291594 RepID=UPI002E2BEE62|nr:aminotransferase class I/II-fold pyridoxal phosphate-dependent enzyme [Micromonospora rifamycinica]